MKSIRISVLVLLLVSPTHALAAKRAAAPRIVGMTYADARALLLSRGWRPRVTCDARVEDCAYQGATTDVFRLRGYVEVESCAVDGPWCIYNFVDRHKRCLRVHVEGEYYPEHKSALKVTSWSNECPDEGA